MRPLVLLVLLVLLSELMAAVVAVEDNDWASPEGCGGTEEGRMFLLLLPCSSAGAPPLVLLRTVRRLEARPRLLDACGLPG